MSHWITVYLKDSPQNLTAKDLQAAIADSDWWTLGEQFDLEDEEVDAFMDAITWKDIPISVGLAKERPLVVHQWLEAERVSEEVKEVTEREGLPSKVLENLAGVRAVVAIEMGLCHFGNMHEVLAFELAYALSEQFQGLICDANDQWYDHAEHRWDPIV